MASIDKRGSTYRVQIRRRGHKPIIRTFATKAAAQRWAVQVEARIEAGEFTELWQWAGQNLADAEIDSLEAALMSEREGEWRLAVEQLRRLRAAEPQRRPQGVQPGGPRGVPQIGQSRSGNAAGGGGFTAAQMVQAMSDPRYRTDAQYREQVRKQVVQMGRR